MKAVCAGDISIDSYLLQKKDFVGGISFNVAWNLRECGHDSFLISALGKDNDGARILTCLQKSNFSTDGIQILPGESALQRILLNPDGERKFDGYRCGVLPQLRLQEAARQHVLTADLIHVPLSDGLEAVFSEIAELPLEGLKAVDFSLDYSQAHSLPEIIRKHAAQFNVVFLGGSSEYIELFRNLSAAQKNTVFILTLGSLGVHAYHCGKEYYCAAPLIGNPVDTTGCGDAFQAGFLSEFARESGIEDALRFGSARAAQVAAHLGATDCSL